MHWRRSDNVAIIFTLRFMSIGDIFLAFEVLDRAVMVLEAGLCINARVFFCPRSFKTGYLYNVFVHCNIV
jgi:hypothetical protein